MSLRRISGLAILAFFGFALQSCVQDPADDADAGGLDGVWMLTESRYSWTQDGFTEKDTIRYDTASVFSREFYYIREGLAFWIQHDVEGDESWSQFSRLRSLGGNRWIWGTGDTLTVTLSGNRLTLESSQEYAYYDDWFGDTVRYFYSGTTTLVAYHREFPPEEWFQPPAPETEPNGTRATANSLTVGGRPLVASLSAGDVDWYSFEAVQGQAYLIQTYGSTDTYMVLYQGQTLLDESDDFEGNNAGFEWQCPATGTYHLRVSGFSTSTAGSYTMGVQNWSWDDELFKPASIKRHAPGPHPMYTRD
jgi:hypothetical protein